MGKHKRRKKDEKQTELEGKEKGETNKGEKERKKKGGKDILHETKERSWRKKKREKERKREKEKERKRERERERERES